MLVNFFQMHNAMSQAASRALTSIFFSLGSAEARPLEEQFLFLHVTRDNIVQNTIDQLIFLNSSDLKKPLKVVFLFLIIFKKKVSTLLRFLILG